MNLNKAQTKRWIKWVEALESGEYKRTSYRLHREDGTMCCLGVAYNEFFDGDWEFDPLREGENYTIFDPSSVRDSQAGVVGDGLRKIMGFPTENGFKTPLEAGLNLTSLNDYSQRDDYSDVIPHIERYLKEYGNPEVLQRNPRYATTKSQ